MNDQGKTSAPVSAEGRVFEVYVGVDALHKIRLTAESPEEARDMAWEIVENMSTHQAHVIRDIYTEIDEIRTGSANTRWVENEHRELEERAA